MDGEGVKEEVSEKPKCAPTADKAGWIKKSSGGLLGLWKDRYILLCKTQLLVYEDEEEQKYIETVELESYDKCQDLRALLKRKNRFILIRSPGKKVHNIKFQAQNLEEKESWMKALNEGINRGKNKILDEVKVDETLSLDHVTRDRVKVGHGRRPPTRIHLKEAANATSDGILRLDLDIVDNGPPELTSTVNENDDVPPPKETPKPPTKPSVVNENDDVPPPKETPKPPMPPTKPSVVNENDDVPPPKETPKPPMPPTKPSVVNENDDVPPPKETPKPPMPPTKPSIVSEKPSVDNSVADQELKKPVSPPMPPAKKFKEGTPSNDNLISKDADADSVNKDEESEESKGPAGDNKENLMEVSNKSHTNAPVPPPKILSEKLKGISWDESALPPQSTEGPKSSMGGSKENITEVVTTDTLKPQVPPKILSERLISANPVLSTSEVKSSESQEPDESTRPVNAMEDGEVTESTPQRVEPEEESKRAADEEEEQQIIQEQIKISLDTETKQEITEVPSKEKTLLPESLGNSSPIRTRCASLGELMDESKNAQKAPADPGCQEETLAKMEEKVACERDKTEKLLQKVLHGELEQAQEGNGPPVNAETILNEAVEQLRQATQVLQEIKGLEELSKEQTEKPKEKQKDLVTLYRRSVP